MLRSNIEQLTGSGRGNLLGGADSAAVRDSLAAVDAIRELTEALMAFAPEESAVPEAVDLVRVLETVVASVRFYAKRGLRITLKRAGEDVSRVRCRSHHLIRSLLLIFVELAETAMSASQPIEVEVEIAPRDGETALVIAVTAAPPFGAPAVLLAQLEPVGVLSRHVGKAGASLCHTVVENQLSITIGLPPDEGATDERRSTAPGAAPLPVAGRRGTLLLVEHDEAVIRSLRRVLDAHHDVLGARTGNEALRIASTNREIDAILIDVSLPGMSGLELAEELERKHPDLASRAIFLSGGAIVPGAGDFLERSGYPVLTKPIDVHELATRVAELIG